MKLRKVKLSLLLESPVLHHMLETQVVAVMLVSSSALLDFELQSVLLENAELVFARGFHRPKKHGHGYGHGDTTRRDKGTRQISKNQDTDTARTRHNTIK